jgi:hypothetical protein
VLIEIIRYLLYHIIKEKKKEFQKKAQNSKIENVTGLV